MIIYIAYFSILSALIPVSVYLIRGRPSHPYIRTIVLLCSLGFAFDITALVVAKRFGGEGVFVVNNLFAVVSFSLLSIATSRMWSELVPKRPPIEEICWGLWMFLFVCASLFFEPLTAPQTIVSVSESIVLTGFSIFLYFGLLKHVSANPKSNNPPVWINFGILLYYAYSTMVFAVSEQLFKDSPDLAAEVWKFHNLANIMKNVIFAIGIFAAGKGKTAAA